MTIHDLYEQSWAERHDCTPDSVKSFRLSNGSYSKADLAAGFRNFKAGYEANQRNDMRVIGYLSAKELQDAEHGEETYLCKIPLPGARIEVFVKQPEVSKTGENHEQ